MRVVVYYKYLPSYRQRFFSLAAVLLAKRGVRCEIWHGRPRGTDALRMDGAEVNASVSLRNIPVPCNSLYAHLPPHCGWPGTRDIVVCEHTLKAPLNLALWLWGLIGGTRFWWWGHGRNLQNPHFAESKQERLKAWLGRRCRGWFSYSPTTDRVIESWIGVPRHRIITIWNAIDTATLAGQVDYWRRQIPHMAASRHFSIPADARVAIFCGSLHAGKGAQNLRLLANAMHGAEVLVVIGAGSESHLIENHPRIITLGYRDGSEKALALARADLYVCPGMIGLNILDAVAAGLPFAGVALETHSPEVDYIADGRGGVLMPAERWPDEALRLLRDSVALQQLSHDMMAKRLTYTVERMASRFVAGVLMDLRRLR